MAVLTVTTTTRAGSNLSSAVAADAALSDSWANTGVEMLYIKNGGGSPITLTLTMQATLDGQAPSNKTVSVGNGAAWIIGPFPTGIYNDANGRCNVSYSAVTSVTVLPFKTGT